MDDSLLGESKKKSKGCCPSYNFALWSRGLAAISVLALLIISIVTIGAGLESSLFGIFTACVVIMIEIPALCKCCCAETVEKLKWCEASKENPKGCLIRAVVYIGFCMAGSAMCVKVNHNQIILLLVFILLGVDGLAYALSWFQGIGSGSTNSDITSAAKKAAAKRAADYARENPDKMEEFAKDAATYAIDHPDAAASFARGALGGDDDVEANSASAWDAADDSWGGN